MLQFERRDGVQYNGQTNQPGEHMKTHPRRPPPPPGAVSWVDRKAHLFSRTNWLPVGKGVSEDDEDSDRDLFADTAATLNKLDLSSIMGCPGGMSTFRLVFTSAFRGIFSLKFLRIRL